MVDIKTFADLVVNGLELYFGDGFSITTNDVVKNNGVTYLGVNINDGSRVAPIIYLNSFYERFSEGEDIESIVEHIISVYRANHTMPGNFCVEDFMDFEKVKPYLSCKLINADSNKELLKDVPHVIFLDLALVFMFANHTDDGCGYSILIKREHLKNWNVTEDEIAELAIRNIKDNVLVKSMADLMREMMGNDVIDIAPPEQISMTVISNKTKQYGAVHILDTELLKEYADKEETDLIILPSSVHECILVPMSDEVNITEMASMVREVNATQLQAEEILSDHPYIYSREKDAVVIAA